MLLRLFGIFFCWHQSSQFFRVFLLPIFQNRSFFGPQGTWAPERWITSRTPYRIGYLHSMKVLSFCFLLSFWTFGQIFSSVLLLPYRSSWFFLDHGSLLRISMFPCFQFCEETEFCPHTRDSNPWKLEQKIYALPTELAGSKRSLSQCFLLSLRTVSQVFLGSSTSAAHRDSFLITVVYSEFLCFLAFSSVKKGSFGHTQETQTLESWNKISTLYRLS